MKRPTKGVWQLLEEWTWKQRGQAALPHLKTFHQARLDEADQNSQNAEN
jgi:hypothetical protein